MPGYKEDEVSLEGARHALQQNYPTGFFDVVIIADSFQQYTLTALKSLPLKVIEVSFDKSTKSKALNKAMATLSNEYDIAVVLDADNLMANDFLSKVNAAFAHGCTAVQGHRAAKNINNSWAILDAVSEEINNNIFRNNICEVYAEGYGFNIVEKSSKGTATGNKVYKNNKVVGAESGVCNVEMVGE